MDTSDEKWNTPLHYAAHAGSSDQVFQLLKDGHNSLCPNAAGLTPLHFAAFGGNLTILRMLLSNAPHAINLQSNIKGSTLLHEAVRGKSLETIIFLLDSGANANLQDQNGDTPLHLAASLKNASDSSIICQALLEKGANPTIHNQEGENFVFAILKRATREGLECLISLALQYQTDLLSRNVDGLSALDKARKMSAPPNVIRLIQHKTQEKQKLFLNQQFLTYPVMEDDKPSHRPEKKIKLIICGHSGVGKTTFASTLKETGLLARFQYILHGSETPPSTQGVSCSQAGLKDGSLVIWDFAGQMEYCFTHSVLLNSSGPNTIYCVVFSLKGIESDQHGGQRQAIEQIIFWMRFLSLTHNPISTPNVILIGSHLDTLPEEHCILIANQFYENVVKRETELFSCFEKQFFPINCQSVQDVKPIRDALAEILANVRQEPEPEICQLVLTHLCTQKVRFQRWQQFIDSITPELLASGYQQICPITLQTAVEYLHNISELLFLPQSIVSGSDAAHVIPSGIIVLDVNWLLQEVFARFGNFALSPASGTEKQLWSLEEVVGALGLNDGEGDAEAALELLEALELVLKTKEGDFVVPAWLKRRGFQKQPTQRRLHKQLRGVGYFWRNDSRVFFSHFFVGKLQIQLIRQYGKHVCKLWKEAALLDLKAQLRLEVSEDKRALYLIGSWRDKDGEGHCFNLLKEVEDTVETLLREEWDQSYEKLYLCPAKLSKITETSCANCMSNGPGIAEEIRGFSFEQILDAEKNNTLICGGNAQPWEVLFPGHDPRMLSSLQWKCRTNWLEASTLEKLCGLLDKTHPLMLDWRRLAELLGQATISIVHEIEEEAKNNRSSPTSLVLNRYPVTLEQLKESLTEMGRDDCVDEIERMIYVSK